MLLRLENPAMLWGFVPLFLILLRVLWKRVSAPELFSWRRTTAGFLAVSLCILALSRPQGGSQVASEQGAKSNLFVALDISRSMLAEDIHPSRLSYMIHFAQKMLVDLGSFKVALYPFAETGFLLMPLSSDVYAAADLIAGLEPSYTTSQGTDFNRVLMGLLEVIQSTEEKSHAHGKEWASPQVLLISDGESHQPVKEETLHAIQNKHIPVFTVTVGTTGGGTIPVEGRFLQSRDSLKDASGKTVVTQAHPEIMERIANVTRGYAFTGKFQEIPSLSRRLRQSMEMGKLTTSFRLELEFFPYLLLAAFAILLVQFGLSRWDYAIRAILFCFLFGVGSARGETQRGPIETYNDGMKSLRAGDYQKAAESFLESSLMTPDKTVQKKALYNLGNAFLKMGDPVQALNAYQRAYDTKTENPQFDNETNQKTSENMVLAAKLDEQMKQKQKQGDSDSEGEGDSDSKGNDPKGPRQYEPEPLTDGMKQRIYDLVSNEEKQTIERLHNAGNKAFDPNGKTW
jgi:Ca-activated chloride channel family protein